MPNELDNKASRQALEAEAARAALKQEAVQFAASNASEATRLYSLINAYGLERHDGYLEPSKKEVPALEVNQLWQLFKDFVVRFLIDTTAQEPRHILDKVEALFQQPTNEHDIATYHKPVQGRNDEWVAVKKRYPLSLVFQAVYLAIIDKRHISQGILNGTLKADVKLYRQLMSALRLNKQDAVVKKGRELLREHEALRQYMLPQPQQGFAPILGKLIFLKAMQAFYPEGQDTFAGLMNAINRLNLDLKQLAKLVNHHVAIELVRYERLASFYHINLSDMTISEDCHQGRRHRLAQGLRHAVDSEGRPIELIETAPLALLNWMQEAAVDYLLGQEETEQGKLTAEWVSRGMPQEMVNHLNETLPKLLLNKLISHGVSPKDKIRQPDGTYKTVKEYLDDYIAVLEDMSCPVTAFSRFLSLEPTKADEFNRLLKACQAKGLSWFKQHKAKVERLSLLHKLQVGIDKYQSMLAIDEAAKALMKAYRECFQAELTTLAEEAGEPKALPEELVKLQLLVQGYKNADISNIFARFFATDKRDEKQRAALLHGLLVKVRDSREGLVVPTKGELDNLSVLMRDAEGNNAEIILSPAQVDRLLLYGYLVKDWCDSYKNILPQVIALIRQATQDGAENRLMQQLGQDSYPETLINRLEERLKRLNGEDANDGRIERDEVTFPFFYAPDLESEDQITLVANAIRQQDIAKLNYFESLFKVNAGEETSEAANRLSAFFIACSNSNNVALITWLIDHIDGALLKAGLKAKDHEALCMAARWGHHHVVEQLLAAYGEDIDFLKEGLKADDHYALRWAARWGRRQVVGQLLKAYGEDTELLQEGLNAYDHYALGMAARNGHHQVVGKLLKAYGKAGLLKEGLKAIGHQALRWAARNGHHPVVEQLLKAYDKDIDLLKAGLKAEIHYALRKAAENGHHHVVEQLLKAYDEDIDLLKAGLKAIGHDALRWAARNGHHHVVEQLLKAYGKAGLLKEGLKARGHDALRMAAERGRHQVIEQLLAAYDEDMDLLKAGLKAIDHEALHWAARSRHTQVVGLLLKAYGKAGLLKEGLKAYDHYALCLAARNGHHQVVGQLLAAYDEALLKLPDWFNLAHFTEAQKRSISKHKKETLLCFMKKRTYKTLSDDTPLCTYAWRKGGENTLTRAHTLVSAAGELVIAQPENVVRKKIRRCVIL